MLLSVSVSLQCIILKRFNDLMCFYNLVLCDELSKGGITAAVHYHIPDVHVSKL